MRREPGDVIDDGGEHAGDYVDDYLAVFDQILSHNITPTYEDTTKNRGCPKIRAAPGYYSDVGCVSCLIYHLVSLLS